LGAGDIYPAHTVEFESQVLSIDSNSELKNEGGNKKGKQLLALGSSDGSVKIHHLAEEFR
jgi:hypothetical protein